MKSLQESSIELHGTSYTAIATRHAGYKLAWPSRTIFHLLPTSVSSKSAYRQWTLSRCLLTVPSRCVVASPIPRFPNPANSDYLLLQPFPFLAHITVLMILMTCFSETSDFLRTTWNVNREGCTLHNHQCDCLKLKEAILFMVPETLSLSVPDAPRGLCCDNEDRSVANVAWFPRVDSSEDSNGRFGLSCQLGHEFFALYISASYLTKLSTSRYSS
jgi:hypothetical protein